MSAVEDSPPRRKSLKGSLSHRVVWLTLCVVLLAQTLAFGLALVRARGAWLRERISDGQIAALSLDASGADRPLGDETASQRRMLRIAGVDAVQVAQPGEGPQTVGPFERFTAAELIDLADDAPFGDLGGTVAALLGGPDHPVLARGNGPVQAETTVSIVFESQSLSRHLRGVALDLLGLGLVVAGLTAAFVYAALRVAVVQPMRRLTDSIAAFRADPERTPPPSPAPIARRRGEMALAERELAEMQRELRGALWRQARLAALGTAVAKVSHDVRGILAPALLAAERLGGHVDPNVRRVGESVMRTIERAIELMRGGLDFVRDDPGPLARAKFGLKAAVAAVADPFRDVFPAVRVDNVVPPNVEIDADRQQIARVLANLLRNAGEAGARHVTIDAAAHPTRLEITLQDDGPGLPPAVVAALFKPFLTGGRSGSTGLGLAIAHDLMRAHGGDIELASTGPTGTCFRLILPPVRPAATPRTGPRQAA